MKSKLNILKRWGALGFCLLGLAACSLVPSGLERDDVAISSLKQLMQVNQDCECKVNQQVVRLGGRILSATALPQQTKLEVLSYPIISFTAKPSLESESDGRFILYLPHFVDPETLKDQFITAKGVLENYESNKIDQYDYTYPVVQAQHYQRWALSPEYYYDKDEMADWRERRRSGLLFDVFNRPEPKIRFKLVKTP